MLPRSAIVQVTKENEHFNVLLRFVPRKGYGLLFATLHEKEPTAVREKPHVEVRIDDKRIGQLTPQMSQRFLPMIQYLWQRGVVAACWGDITGSAVAAKVRIDAIKANEAAQDVLDGPPATIPLLVPELLDPLDYDLTAMQPSLAALPLVQPVSPPMAAEPQEGSLIRFNKGSGRYHYVAVRLNERWETTATGGGRSISEVMSWTELASRVRKFEIATAWDRVNQHGDARVRKYLAVARFTIGDKYLAAINIDAAGREDGDWYTTINERSQQRLPLDSVTRWSDIAENGKHIQVVTAWTQLS
jgi:hypothetical protein